MACPVCLSHFDTACLFCRDNPQDLEHFDETEGHARVWISKPFNFKSIIDEVHRHVIHRQPAGDDLVKSVDVNEIVQDMFSSE